MQKKEFQAESKRLLDLMIHSIYTHKEIFLRELISNASDAIDKLYYVALTDPSMEFNPEDYYIRVVPNKEQRTLTIEDTGIGMSEQELEENLGVIAKSGSLGFKKENQQKDGHEIIGQFGVGFYAAFMVADEVTVLSRAHGQTQAFRWHSTGAEGYTIEPAEREQTGTTIVLKIKENTEEEEYDQYLEEFSLRSIIKKYSDFIRYPIRMTLTQERLKEGSEEEYEEYQEEKTINSMIPLWKKNKNELTEEDYHNFYMEKHYGFDKPLRHIHISADGAVRYDALLYIPSSVPFDFYTKEYEKGLELYSSGVLIMNKNPDLLPDYYSFVKGLVDSEDLSLNISRELLQHDRQLRLIAKRIKDKITAELVHLQKNDRDGYETFWKSFGRQIKYGIYSEFGKEKETLQDLVLFYSSSEKKLVTLNEYKERMKNEQEVIYYAAGDSIERIDKLPQTEMFKERGFEILYFTEEVDEFCVKMMRAYGDKEFRNVSSAQPEEKDQNETEAAQNKERQDLFGAMQEILKDKVSEVKASTLLKNHPVFLSSKGELSLEMEKVLAGMPGAEGAKAERVLELNPSHPLFAKIEQAYQEDREKFALYTHLLYNQAQLIEGFPIEDPIAYSDQIWKLLS